RPLRPARAGGPGRPGDSRDVGVMATDGAAGEPSTYLPSAFFNSSCTPGTSESFTETNPNELTTFPFSATTAVKCASRLMPQSLGPDFSPGKTDSVVDWNCKDI